MGKFKMRRMGRIKVYEGPNTQHYKDVCVRVDSVPHRLCQLSVRLLVLCKCSLESEKIHLNK